MKLRQLTFLDLSAMTALDGECFSPEDAYSPDMMAWFFLRPGTMALGYFDGEALAAFILWTGREIITLDVERAFRRRSLARTLMEHALLNIQKRGYREVFLQVDQDNARALALYRSMGFEVARGYCEDGKQRYEMIANLKHPLREET